MPGVWKNPENLTSRQQAMLAWVAKTDPRLHRAYPLREGLGLVFHLSADEADVVWVGWARRCRIPAFVERQQRIVKHRASILAAIEHGLSNGRIESVNTKIQLITRVAFGFRSPRHCSLWPCLTSAATNPPLQAGHDPRKSQGSLISALSA